MATVHISVERARGCGFRKAGGIYLMMGKFKGFPCGTLPIKVHVCPVCNMGIKQSRGFQWILPELLRDLASCKTGKCDGCSMNDILASDEPIGLLWVGKSFYSPESFMMEALQMGISKRIGGIPKDLVIGKTWIALGHPECIQEVTPEGDIVYAKGIFTMFRPRRIEYVVTGEETEEELDALEKRGLTLVKVVKDEGPLKTGGEWEF